MSVTPESAEAPPQPVSLGEATRTWMQVGLQSFGGPAGQISVMHRILVEEKRWLREDQFLHALNYCMLLPGPEAQQLAIYSGWLLHGHRGGLIAGWLFVLPGFLSILALSLLYVWFPEASAVEGFFFGLQAAVLALVVDAVLRIGRRALKRPIHRVVALLAFTAIFFLTLPFPLVIIAAGGVGLAEELMRGPTALPPAPLAPPASRSARSSAHHAVRTLGLWGGLWIAPVAILTVALGSASVWSELARFFSQAAIVTFGGAYSVLAYIAQEAVETRGWLRPEEMLTGLGMAETTPGPLIQIVQYVGFLAAYRNPGDLDPTTAGVLAAILVTWVTFAPCFLWIFLGAPYMERLRDARRLNAALSMVTAAVVGAILSLAVWFAIHTVFADVEDRGRAGVRLLVPDPETIDVAAVVIAVGAGVALFRYRIGVLRILSVAALTGILYQLALG